MVSPLALVPTTSEPRNTKASGPARNNSGKIGRCIIPRPRTMPAAATKALRCRKSLRISKYTTRQVVATAAQLRPENARQADHFRVETDQQRGKQANTNIEQSLANPIDREDDRRQEQSVGPQSRAIFRNAEQQVDQHRRQHEADRGPHGIANEVQLYERGQRRMANQIESLQAVDQITSSVPCRRRFVLAQPESVAEQDQGDRNAKDDQARLWVSQGLAGTGLPTGSDRLLFDGRDGVFILPLGTVGHRSSTPVGSNGCYRLIALLASWLSPIPSCQRHARPIPT